MKKIFMTIIATLAISASAQPKQIDYDAISKGTFAPRGVHGLRSMNDGEHYTTLNGSTVVRYRYADGEAANTVFSASTHKLATPIDGYQFCGDESMMLLQTESESIYRHSARANFWVYDIAKDTLYVLSSGGKQQEATLSPDGRKAAFVRDNNIFVVDLIKKTERQITSDGVKGEVINGIPDWVYEEEYSFSRAFEWSSSSDAIAYYRFDESRVKEYSINTFNGKLYPVNLDFKYPKAGEDNSIVQIRTYNLSSGSIQTMDIGIEQDQYIPRIQWTGRKDELVIHRINRLQNNYQMLFANSITGASRVIYNEASLQYIDRIDDQKVTFLPDGQRFIVMNENDGWRHLYLYDMNGRFQQQITKGEWEVISLDGIDSRNNKLYYTSTEQSSIGRDFYSVDFGSRRGVSAKPNRNKKMLTSANGYNLVSMSAGAHYYINTYSNAATPTVVSLHKADGTQLRILEDNKTLTDRLSEWDMPVKEFFEIEINGEKLNAYMMKPSNFDPTKQYPLFMTQYSGPGSQSVLNRWSVSWESALLKEGYIVACVDGRGTGGKGEKFRKCTYGNLGGLEVEDQISVAQWFAEQAYIDASRIGIYGWSYGGFMALNCILKGSDVFALAIAVAPVTSWRYYDTIYTEVYNGKPQDNPEGYDDNSPINFAANLKGKLLLAHGTADDNVHIQNSYEMIEELIRAGKDFEWAIYPDKDHGMGTSRNHLMLRSIEFVKTNL